jgi:hypothetical protein
VASLDGQFGGGGDIYSSRRATLLRGDVCLSLCLSLCPSICLLPNLDGTPDERPQLPNLALHFGRHSLKKKTKKKKKKKKKK